MTALFWLIAKLISWNLWTGKRLFPLVPVFEFLNELPFWYHDILFFISLVCLGVLVIKPTKTIAGILTFSELFSALGDQNRWQPWEYQYLFILFLFLLNKNQPLNFRSAVRLILISIYLFSGISKLNDGFLHSIWSGMLLRQYFGIIQVTSKTPFLYYAGFSVGFLEIICATGLLFKRSAGWSAGVLTGIHCFILLVLGPLGINYNAVIWPWNIAMIGYLYILFMHRSLDHLRWNDFKAGWNKLVIACWFILPSFNLFGWWDNYLSSVLYSGKLNDMVICIKNEASIFAKPFEPYFIHDYKQLCDGDKMISVTKWAMKEMKVPVYPERRIFLKIEKSLKQKYNLSDSRYFLVNRSLTQPLR